MWSFITDMTKIHGHVATAVIVLAITERRTACKESNKEKKKLVKNMALLFNK